MLKGKNVKAPAYPSVVRQLLAMAVVAVATSVVPVVLQSRQWDHVTAAHAVVAAVLLPVATLWWWVALVAMVGEMTPDRTRLRVRTQLRDRLFIAAVGTILIVIFDSVSDMIIRGTCGFDLNQDLGWNVLSISAVTFAALFVLLRWTSDDDPSE